MASIPWIMRVRIFSLQVVFTVFGFIKLIITILTHPLTSFKKKSRTVPPKVLQDSSYGTHEYITVNGIKFHYVTAGDKSNPFMLLLHGFPEFWLSWRYQLKELQKTFNVVAIDMRGYGETEKPTGRHNYTISILKQDIVELIKALSGGKKCTLVAHDWGGLIAWRVVQNYPEIIERFIVLNCPHQIPYERALARGREQLFKSWYIFLFQTAMLPELIISMRDLRMFNAMYRGKKAGLKNTQNFSNDIMEAFKYTFGKKGALTPPINYYRNLLSIELQSDSKVQISTPTLLIWGEDDEFLSSSMVEDHKLVCENLTIKRIPNCSHWVQQDCPELVNQYIKDFADS